MYPIIVVFKLTFSYIRVFPLLFFLFFNFPYQLSYIGLTFFIGLYSFYNKIPLQLYQIVPSSTTSSYIESLEDIIYILFYSFFNSTSYTGYFQVVKKENPLFKLYQLIASRPIGYLLYTYLSTDLLASYQASLISYPSPYNIVFNSLLQVKLGKQGP